MILLEKTLTFLLLVTSLGLFSQTEKVAGEYFRSMGDKNEHLIEYTLILNENGTFSFHSYKSLKKGNPREENIYGKGNWNLDGKVVSFFTHPQKEIDEKYTLDFSNSRARFITKPERDKTDRIIETRLQFFESEIFWIERLKILKRKNPAPQRL